MGERYNLNVCVFMSIYLCVFIICMYIIYVYAYTHTHLSISHKRCSISLIIREMKIRMTLRYHFSPIRLVKIKRYNTFFWPGYYRGGSHFRTLLVECKPVQPFWRETWQASMNDTCICFWPTIPLLGICPEDIPLLVPNHRATISLITTL